MKIRFYDLFAGIGGIRLGFEQACAEMGIEHECVLSSEINAKACETYRLNFNEEPKGDIANIHDLPGCDFILAGFPCQAFSYAGSRKGFGDTRGTLFFEVERILNALVSKPRGFLLENVRGLVTHDKGCTLNTIIAHLESLGYGITWLLLNSCNFGVPQNRMRIYILGLLDRKPTLILMSDRGPADSHIFKRKRPQRELSPTFSEPLLVKDILDTNTDPKYRCSDEFVRMLSKVVGHNYDRLHGVRLIDYRGGNSVHSWELGIKGECSQEEINFMNALIGNRRKKVFGIHQDGKMLTLDQIRTFYHSADLADIMDGLLQKGYLRKFNDKFNPVCGNMSFEAFKFLDPDSISITLVASDAHRLGVVQNNIPRRITPRECARLQGFPDGFICHPDDTAAYHQFGNAVTVPVVKAVVKDYLENNWA